jgi:hypothetical protein
MVLIVCVLAITIVFRISQQPRTNLHIKRDQIRINRKKNKPVCADVIELTVADSTFHGFSSDAQVVDVLNSHVQKPETHNLKKLQTLRQ